MSVRPSRRYCMPRPPSGGFYARTYNPFVGLAEKLDTLPLRPGVYLFKDAAGEILYVGKARVLRDRVRSYFQASRPTEFHKSRMVADIADLDLVVTDSEMEALALENNLIKRHQPLYNVRLRDDKNHPYLKLTLAEEYPRLYVVRRPAEDGNAYGGPYIPASLGRKTSGLVRKLFGIRSCKETLERPAPAALPAVPDQALPGPLRGRGLQPRTLPHVLRRRAALPGRPDRGGGEAPARGDGGRRRFRAVRGGGLGARPGSRPRAARHHPEDHHHRPGGARPLRRPRRGRAGGRAGLQRARWKSGGAGRLPARPPHRARGGAREHHPAVLCRSPLRPPRAARARPGRGP